MKRVCRYKSMNYRNMKRKNAQKDGNFKNKEEMSRNNTGHRNSKIFTR